MAKAASARTESLNQRAGHSAQGDPRQAEMGRRNRADGRRDDRRRALQEPAPAFAPTKVEDVAGMLRGRGRTSRVVSIEEMDEAVLAEARRRYLRSFDDRD